MDKTYILSEEQLKDYCAMVAAYVSEAQYTKAKTVKKTNAYIETWPPLSTHVQGEGWISVKDRLPENELPVIVSMYGETQRYLYRYHPSQKCWTMDDSIIRETNIEHWQPLPPSPNNQH